MEALLHRAKKIGIIECLGRVLDWSGVHRQCRTDKSCVKGKKTAAFGKVQQVL